MQQKDRSPTHSDVKGRLGLDAPDVKSSKCLATWSLVQSRVEDQKHFPCQCYEPFCSTLISRVVYTFFLLKQKRKTRIPWNEVAVVVIFRHFFQPKCWETRDQLRSGSHELLDERKSMLKTSCDRALWLQLQDFGTTFLKPDVQFLFSCLRGSWKLIQICFL